MQLLQLIKPIVYPYVSWSTWYNQELVRANRIILTREYAEGEHRSSLTEEMRNMLRIKTAELGAPFNINHMDNIIQTVVDRLEVTGMESDSADANAWFTDALRDNRFDGLQLDVHEAAVRDGDAYIMVSFENGEVKLTQEDAFDGTNGVIMVYGPDKNNAILALKIWQEMATADATGATRKVPKLISRVNAYYPDRIEKYISHNNTSLMLMTEDAETVDYSWKLLNGDSIGIPLIHFRNRSAKNRNGGMSEIRDAIPLQDTINRTLASMVMASELTAFQIRYSIGLKPPSALTPGMWISAYTRDPATNLEKVPQDNQIEWLKAIRFGTLEQGQLMPFIDQAKFAIDQMYMITRTPRQDSTDNVSGESLKQKEIGLIGKARRCHVSFGNAWENTARIMWRVQSAFGTVQPPEYKRVETRWRSPELRNDTAIVDNVLKVADRLDERTVLQLLAPVFNWDNNSIDAILTARRGDTGARLATLAANIPSFKNFNGQPITP